VKYKPSIAVHS